MNTTSNSPCPQCGALLPPDAPSGLCPRCLMEMNLASNTQLGDEIASGKTPAVPSPVPPAAEELQSLFPELEILECLGQGGMGIVYKAKQTELERIVALKILPHEIGEASGFAARFAREARALAKLNHPGIVTLYEFGRVECHRTQTGRPIYFFLMEYVDGVNLRRLLHGDRMSPREALAVVPQICDALQFAHDHGVVHRDIKPENILIDRRGTVKVADFGLAKIAAVSEGQASTDVPTSAPVPDAHTEVGKVMGTPHYMSPEQIERPDQVDHRTDIYALGVVFYQMLTGEMPGQPFEPPSQKVQIDVRLDDVVLRALERDPGRRYAQASILKTQVEEIATSGAARTPDKDSPAETSVLAGESRAGTRLLSRAAIVGLLWIGLFFLNWVISYTPPGWALTRLFRHSPLHLVSEVVLFLPLMVLGFSALVGGTVMGGLALYQIRQTRGAIDDFGLALFDVLFFPLVLISVWLLWLTRQVIAQVEAPPAMVASVFLLGGLVFHGILIWMAIRKARHFVCSPVLPVRRWVQGSWAQAIRLTLWRLALVTAMHLLLFETIQQLAVTWKESTGELCDMGLAVVTLGGLVWATWPGYRFRRSWWFWAGGTALSSFALLALVNFYSWHLRPNLGLYREPEWVALHPGFQKKIREEIQANLWGEAGSDDVTGGVAAAQAPFVGRLPDGSVELVALSHYPSADQVWWSPGGIPFDTTPFTVEASGGGSSTEFHWFSMVARLRDVPATATATWAVAPRNSWATGEAFATDGRSGERLLMVSTKQPRSATTANVRIGLASGAWDTLAAAAAGAIPPMAQSGAFGEIAFLPPVDTDEGIRLSVTHAIRGMEMRLVAVGADGTHMTGSNPEQMVSESLGHTTVIFTDLSLQRAIQGRMEFHFQGRPYRWIEFGNVSLRPGETTAVDVVYEL